MLAPKDFIGELNSLEARGISTANFKMCVVYKMPDGNIIENFPPTLEAFEGCTPIYEEFEGLNEDISNCRSFDEFPENCKKYIEALEKLVGCRVSTVGIVPDRSQILER